ncbi:MAG: rhomboid family intramembrane serine protease [Verrucomicrobia bacterium]|nr:rhomboid family intramembrane serine protease [Verrucomicrobiota bacterium]
MILPLSDAPNPKGAPIVTWSLIALNVLIFVLISWPLSQQPADPNDPLLREYLTTVREVLPSGVSVRDVLRNTSAYDLYTFQHGFRPAQPELRDLFTSLFLHGGLAHLLGNMLFLWIYGDNVEYRLGRLRYLFYYLLTGVAATLFYSLFAPNSKLPLVGASGAISGVLGFYFIWFPKNTVRLFVFLFPFFMNVIQVSARFVLGIYLVLDNLLPFVLTHGSQGGGVAHGAHIGGFIAGLLIALLRNRRETMAAPKEYRPSRKAPPAPLDEVADALERGDMAGAASAYFALPPEQTRRLLTPAEMLALGDWLAANGHPDAALTMYRRLLRDYPRGPGLAEAHTGAGWVQLEAKGQVAAAYQHFMEALDLDPAPETFTRARAGLDAVARRQRFAIRR